MLMQRATGGRGCAAAASILMIGACAAGASAQNAESGAKSTGESASASSAPRATVSTSTRCKIVLDDGSKLAFDVADGAVSNVTLNGESIPKDRVKTKDGRLVILGKDGAQVCSTDLPKSDSSAPSIHVESGVLGEVLNKIHGQLRLVGPNGDVAEIVLGPEDLASVNKPKQWTSVALKAWTPPKAIMGVQMETPDAQLAGHFGLKPGQATVITAVYPGLPAAKAGIEPYDLVVGMDGEKSAGREAIIDALHEKDPGQTVRLTVLHEGKKRTVDVKLVPYDAASAQLSVEVSSGPRVLPPVTGAFQTSKGQQSLYVLPTPPAGGNGPFQWYAQMAGEPGPDLQARMDRIEAKLDDLQRMIETLTDRLEPADSKASGAKSDDPKRGPEGR